MTSHDVEPDAPLSPEQCAAVERLSPAQVQAIDAALMSIASPRWRKVAFLVGTVMCDESARFPDIPDIYYAQRVRSLVQKGLLEAQGYLGSMRYGEVRLPASCEMASET